MPCKRCQTPTIRDAFVRKSLLEERVFVGVRRRAAAEEAQFAVAVFLQRVPGAGGDQHGVARADRLGVAVDLHPAGALQNEVDLLGGAVVVALRRLVGLERRLGEALHLGATELTNGRAVLRDQELGAGARAPRNSDAASASATRSCASRSSAVKNGSASVRELAS